MSEKNFLLFEAIKTICICSKICPDEKYSEVPLIRPSMVLYERGLTSEQINETPCIESLLFEAIRSYKKNLYLLQDMS